MGKESRFQLIPYFISDDNKGYQIAKTRYKILKISEYKGILNGEYNYDTLPSWVSPNLEKGTLNVLAQ